MPSVFLSSGEIELVAKLVQKERESALCDIQVKVAYPHLEKYLALLDSIMGRLKERLVK